MREGCEGEKKEEGWGGISYGSFSAASNIDVSMVGRRCTVVSRGSMVVNVFCFVYVYAIFSDILSQLSIIIKLLGLGLIIIYWCMICLLRI